MIWHLITKVSHQACKSLVDFDYFRLSWSGPQSFWLEVCDRRHHRNVRKFCRCLLEVTGWRCLRPIGSVFRVNLGRFFYKFRTSPCQQWECFVCKVLAKGVTLCGPIPDPSNQLLAWFHGPMTQSWPRGEWVSALLPINQNQYFVQKA